VIPEGYEQQEWQEILRRGKELVQEDNDRAWAWGDWANDIAPAGPRGGDPKRENALAVAAEEVGYEGAIGTLMERRRVAFQWPDKNVRTFLSWSVAAALGQLDDREELAQMTPAQLMQLEEHEDGSKWTVTLAKRFVKSRGQDTTRREEIMSTLGALRVSLIKDSKPIFDTFSALTTSIPAQGLTGQEAMLQQLDEMEAILHAVRERIQGGTIDDAVMKILEEAQS
jgi:hypothetical protein